MVYFIRKPFELDHQKILEQWSEQFDIENWVLCNCPQTVWEGADDGPGSFCLYRVRERDSGHAHLWQQARPRARLQVPHSSAHQEQQLGSGIPVRSKVSHIWRGKIFHTDLPHWKCQKS